MFGSPEWYLKALESLHAEWMLVKPLAELAEAEKLLEKYQATISESDGYNPYLEALKLNAEALSVLVDIYKARFAVETADESEVGEKIKALSDAIEVLKNNQDKLAVVLDELKALIHLYDGEDNNDEEGPEDNSDAEDGEGAGVGVGALELGGAVVSGGVSNNGMLPDISN